MARRSAFIVSMAALVLASARDLAFAQLTSPGIGPPSADSRSPASRRGQAPAARPNTASVPLDRVVAVVNNEAVTQFDVNEQKRLVLSQMRDAKVQPPPPDALEKQVLDRLVTERALLQYAKDSGVRVDDQTVERTILRVAQENKLSPEEFRKVLEREKIPYAKYREDIRREITIQRLREREVDSHIVVSDAELDAYLATVAAQAGGEMEYDIAHVLVSVPEQATPDQIDARRKRAEDALAQIESGKDFREVAAAFSDAPDGVKGGDLGWRTPARLPVRLRRGGEEHEEGGRLAGAAQSGRLPRHQARRFAQPQRADGGRTDARQAHPDPRQRNHVGYRGARQDRAHTRPHRDRREIRRSGQAQFR